MKQKQIKCPYCGASANLLPASAVYGESTKSKNAYLYVCAKWPACNAYVQAHEKTRRPMGTLANGDLRHKRILAHRALTAFQYAHHMQRQEVYLWLRIRLELSEKQAHIGLFSDSMCDRVIALCRQTMDSDHPMSA